MDHKFIKIEVHAILRGKPISYSISNPLGISYKTYQKIDSDAVRAFGNIGTRTVGIFSNDQTVVTS